MTNLLLTGGLVALVTSNLVACDRSASDSVALTKVDLNDVMPSFSSVSILRKSDAALMTPSSEQEPSFSQFIAANKKITFGELSDNKPVQDLAAFLDMKGYFLNLYSGVQILKTIDIGTQTFDCVPIQQQPSLRGELVVDQPPDGGGSEPILGYPDMACDPGQIPIKRVSLPEIAQYQTLRDYFAKDKGIGRRLGADDYRSHLPAPVPGAPEPSVSTGRDNHVHRYAVIISKPIQISGLAATLNVWNPKTSSDEMSLSQAWIAGGTGSQTQTVESGWQVRKGLDLPYAVPFVYWTRDNYVSGCYNLECAGFVQVTNQVVFARFADGRYSVKGGYQSAMEMVWKRKPNNGNWWLMINGAWVGYFPSSLFGGGALAQNDEKLIMYFGGENTGKDPNSQMGSGEFGSKGFEEAAFASGLSFVNSKGAIQGVIGTPFVTDSNCYNIAMNVAEPGTSLGAYFYFGGPGLSEPACAKSVPSG